jgi:Zn finger protein HypA/HybF involved in hydrogenase expression
MKTEPDHPITLGQAAKTSAEVYVWCKTCDRQNRTDPADVADLYGAELPIVEWRKRLVCSRCGSRDVEVLFMGRRRARH